jgi:hypothetical protein
MRYLALLVIVGMFAIGAAGQTAQTAPAGPVTITVDNCANTPYLFNCVNQVNGRNVCPYGRVTIYPLPGQPYTIFTYPKVDQNGNPIPFNTNIPGQSCVWTLPPLNPLDPSTWPTGAHL